MSASQSGTFNVQEFSDLGAPLVGGRLYTYAYGTTTQKTAYTDHAGAVPHTYTSDGIGGQYIALNSRGELPAPLYLTGGSYDIALKTAAGATVWTRRADPVWDIVNDLSTSSGASLVGYQPAGTGVAATTVQAALRGITAGASAQNLLDVTNIACWGDSLTAGSGGTPYPTQLGLISGYTTYNGGVGGDTSTQIKTRFLAASSQWSKLTIIWAGRNNYADPSTVLSDVASMVASLGHDGYMVLSVINGSYGGYEIPGGTGYNQIAALNTALATAYGDHYLDIRSILVASYNPSLPQDVIDHTNDTPPTSLRSDALHLNTAGYATVAAAIKSNISKLRGTRGVPISSVGAVDLLANPPQIGTVTPNYGRFTSLLATFFQLGGKNVSISGDNLSFQFGANINPSVDATYDMGTSYRWRDLFLSRNLTAAGTATIGQVQTLQVTKLVNAGSSVDLLSTGGTYNDCIAGTMVIYSRKTSGAGLTLSTYGVSMIGSGTSGGITQTSTENYGGGAATFTLTETRDLPIAGQNKLTFNNTSGVQVNVVIVLTLSLATTAPVAL